MIPIWGSKFSIKQEKRKEKITIKICPCLDSNWDLLGGRSVYHPLDYRGLLEFETRIYDFIFLCKNQLIFEIITRQKKAAEFYNIKTRPYLWHFLVKILFQTSFALAAITVSNFWPRGQNSKNEIVETDAKKGSWILYHKN